MQTILKQTLIGLILFITAPLVLVAKKNPNPTGTDEADQWSFCVWGSFGCLSG